MKNALEAGATRSGLRDRRESTARGLNPSAPASSPYQASPEFRLLLEARAELDRLVDQALLGRRPETWELHEVSRALRIIVHDRVDSKPIGGL